MARKITMIPQTINPQTRTAMDTRTKRKVAGYARVSTDYEEQITSYEAQVDYYTNYIQSRDDWEFVKVYTDAGISATNTRHREGFNQMVEDALAGKIDLIITKSVSRFARNTVDSLTTVRKLKEKGIEVYFEKEGIYTLDSKGKLLITIMSSLAQEESRSISENVTWGQRKRFADGKVSLPYSHFLGYKKGEDGLPEIVPEEAEIVRFIYRSYMNGQTSYAIAKILTERHIPTPAGKENWRQSTIESILTNEKYKGDALLQKSYTVDFLTKKRTQNKGEIQMFYVEDDHDAIISKRIWECVQLEIKRRKKYLEEHGTNSYSHRPESNPFASKIICGDCNKVFARKGWRSSTGVDRKVWQCSERYKVKGVMGCANRHVEEKTLIKAYLMAWNVLVENREDFMEQWTEQLQSENLLEGYRAEKFIEYIDGAEPLTEMDTDFMLKTLDHIKVFEDGTLLVVFLDGTETECKNEEE